MAKFAGLGKGVAPPKAGSKGAIAGPKRIKKVLHKTKKAPKVKKADRSVSEYVQLNNPEDQAAYKKIMRMYKEKLLQPRSRTYGGMGLAKPSVWIDCTDTNFMENFQEIYKEHINGFASGAASFKGRQKDENMLWRQRLKARQDGQIEKKLGDIEGDIEESTLMRDTTAASTRSKAHTLSNTKPPARAHIMQPSCVKADYRDTSLLISKKVIGTTNAEQVAAAKNVSIAPANPFNKKKVQNVTKGKLDVEAQRKAVEQYRLLKQRQRQQTHGRGK
eukprot:CFRG0687T1